MPEWQECSFDFLTCQSRLASVPGIWGDARETYSPAVDSAAGSKVLV